MLLKELMRGKITVVLSTLSFLPPLQRFIKQVLQVFGMFWKPAKLVWSKAIVEKKKCDEDVEQRGNGSFLPLQVLDKLSLNHSLWYP